MRSAATKPSGPVVGSRLRHLREDRGISQAELARRLEISASYLNQIERDRRPLTVAVLLRLTETFDVEPDFFSGQDTARLIAELREAMLDEAVGADVSPSEISELATAMPSVARAFIALRRRHHDMVEQTSALAGGRGYLGASTVPMPHEQVRDYFYDRQNYIGVLDQAGEQLADGLSERADLRAALAQRLREAYDIRVLVKPSHAPTEELRRYDPGGRVLRLSEELRPDQQAFQLATQVALLEHSELLSELASEGNFEPQTAALVRIGLSHYFAGSVLMPYTRFHAAAEESRYDIELLADRFHVSFESICHRLSTLQRPRLRGVPFSFVRVDRAGNISKRQSATGFQFSRGGGACPLWNVYEAFETPGRLLRQVAEMPDGRAYFWIARTVGRKRVGFGQATKTFALGLGCELRHAHRLVYSDGLALDDRRLITPIGMGCKTCERAACVQRAFPAVHRPLTVDETRTTLEPYRLS